MINILVVVILLLAIVQYSDSRFPAIVFASFAVAHSVGFDGSEGNFYYISAAVFDLAVVYLVNRFSRINFVSDAVIMISSMSILCHFSGWLLWSNHIPITSYNLYASAVSSYNHSITALYCIAILSFLWNTYKNDYQRTWNSTGFRVHPSVHGNLYIGVHTETKP